MELRHRGATRPHQAQGSHNFVDVRPGDAPRRLLERLQRAGGVRHRRRPQHHHQVRGDGDERRLQQGEAAARRQDIRALRLGRQDQDLLVEDDAGAGRADRAQERRHRRPVLAGRRQVLGLEDIRCQRRGRTHIVVGHLQMIHYYYFF